MFKSEAQRRYLTANHPEIAKEFHAATPKDSKLPERLGEKPTQEVKVQRGLNRAFPNR